MIKFIPSSVGMFAATMAGLIVVPILVFVIWVKFIAYPDYSYRYRLTLAIEMDGEVHTGSSVIEVTWNGQYPIPDVGSYRPSLRGQAALVDLGKYGTLSTSLIAPSYLGREGVDATFLVPRAFGVQSDNQLLPHLSKLVGKRDLQPDNMPRLIWFSNLADPTTARVVELGDLRRLIGVDVRLATAIVENTRDPIMLDIDKRLPWFKDLAARQKNGLFVSDPYRFQLYYLMFRQD